jgi:two-component system chemotaxis response regulator CheY
MRVLIAEDDFAGRKLLQKFLSQYGECDVAMDGMEALDLFLASLKEKKPYDLICLDIMMPRLDGLRLLKMLRDIESQNKIESHTKVIMITALNDRETVNQSYENGCQAFAWKPIDLDKFKQVLVKLDLI